MIFNLLIVTTHPRTKKYIKADIEKLAPYAEDSEMHAVLAFLLKDSVRIIATTASDIPRAWKLRSPTTRVQGNKNTHRHSTKDALYPPMHLSVLSWTL